ncbi:MAG: DUF2066 domain-containing protein [Alphaproteobacteria bacterium]|nr:DUF2066 domain-containing protein [Alphaproteobacteria bacterium]
MIRQRLAWRLRAATAALLLSMAPAGAQSLYTIGGNTVDVTAATAIQARERALGDAQQAAARKLLERLVVPPGTPLPRLSASQVAGLVQDVEIADEKVLPTRYIASVTVRFRPEAVQQFLRDQGLRFAEREGRPVLVLPVLDLPDGPVLFDDRNAWLRAWADRPQSGAVPLAVPLGDLADVGALTAPQALAGDRGRVAALARRYGADEVAVVRATPGAGGNVAVAVTMLRADGAAPVGRTSHPNQDGSYAAAVRATGAVFDRQWRAAAAVAAEPGTGGALLVTAPAANAEEWATLRRRLAETAGVEMVEVVALAAGTGRLRLRYRGDPTRLQAALAPLGVRLDQGPAETPLTR